MRYTRMLAIATLALFTIAGCSSSGVSRNTKREDSHTISSKPRNPRDAFFKWIGVLSKAPQALVVPGMPHGFVTGPLYQMNIGSGKVRQVDDSTVGFEDAVTDNTLGEFVLSGVSTSQGLLSSSLWVYNLMVKDYNN